jgi:hypothetical protein
MKRLLLILIAALLWISACQEDSDTKGPDLAAVTVARDPTLRVTSPPVSTTSPISLPSCDQNEVARQAKSLRDYTPTEGEFITINNRMFWDGETPFIVRGLNYYPAEFPFLPFMDVDVDTLQDDLNIIKDTGINTLRIFIWSEPLFTCPGNGVVPVAQGFEHLDTIIQTIAEHNIRLIVTLNEFPAKMSLSPYEYPDLNAQRMAFLVERYKNEPAILAWDVRNSGNLDYQRGNSAGIDYSPDHSRVDILDWLIRTAGAIREADPNHLITAGWSDDVMATSLAVDFLSFQYWDKPANFLNHLSEIRQQSDKAILLIATGYESATTNPSQQSLALRELLEQAEGTIETDNLAGWLVWTAFDFMPGSGCKPVPCPEGLSDPRHYYGIWKVSGTPKPAVNVIEVISQPTPTALPTTTPTPEDKD